MKKILFSVCISFASITGYAQAVVKEGNSKMQIGFSVGPSITNMIDKYAYQYERSLVFTPRKISYSAAFHFHFQFNKTYALRTELFYTKKRIRTDGLSGYYFYDMAFVNAIKIELPVFFRINIQGFFIEAGPYLGMELGERFTSLYFFKKKVSDRSHSFHWNNDKFFYWGACLGVGYNVLSREKYSLSLSLRDDLEFTAGMPISSTRLNTVNLLLGVAFKI